MNSYISHKSNNWFFSRLSKLSAKNRYFILKSLLKAGDKTYYNQAIDTVVPAQELGDVPKKPAPENEHWGYHLIIDMSGCSNTDKHDHVLSFFENLIKKLKMKPLSKPVITSVHGGEQGRGTSCMQLITTSSITYHSDDQKDCIYLDIFTCKSFEPKDAFAVIDEYFHPKNIGFKWIFRDCGKWPKHQE